MSATLHFYRCGSGFAGVVLIQLIELPSFCLRQITKSSNQTDEWRISSRLQVTALALARSWPTESLVQWMVSQWRYSRGSFLFLLYALRRGMYYARKRLVHGVKRLLGMRTFAARYEQLLLEIDTLKPQRILEIGTNDGLNAVRLCQRAARYRNDVIYYGFDLFEAQTEESYLREFALRVPRLSRVKSYLAAHNLRFELYPGDTTVTLRDTDLPPMDLVFIDGGHSLETVAADWENVRRLLHRNSVVYFDDYPNWGIGTVVDRIDRAKWRVTVLPATDFFGDRSFQFARVEMT